MLHGHIVETGTPAQIADDLTSAYLGGHAIIDGHTTMTQEIVR